MRPPSSWPTGTRFSAVTKNPTLAGQSDRVDHDVHAGAETAELEVDQPAHQQRVAEVDAMLGRTLATSDQPSPRITAGTAISMPASGPAAAMSKSELRSRAGERMRMMAPSVPNRNSGGAACG